MNEKKYFYEEAKKEYFAGEKKYVEFYNARIDALKERIGKILQAATIRTLPREEDVLCKVKRFRKKKRFSSWRVHSYGEVSINLRSDGVLVWCKKYTRHARPIKLEHISGRADERKRDISQSSLGDLCFDIIEANMFSLPDSLDASKRYHKVTGKVPGPNDKK